LRSAITKPDNLLKFSLASSEDFQTSKSLTMAKIILAASCIAGLVWVTLLISCSKRESTEQNGSGEPFSLAMPPSRSMATPKLPVEPEVDTSKDYMINGTILQKVEGGGLLVFCGDHSEMLWEPGVPLPGGVVLLVKYPKEGNLVDGDKISTKAWTAGTFSYIATTGARKTVHRYVAH
jgi:hypothetical protein